MKSEAEEVLAGDFIPEFQHLTVDDAWRLGARGPLLRVARLEPLRALVVRSGDGNWVWAFVLEPCGQMTCLISRNRIATPGASRAARAVTRYVMEPGSLVMERKMLVGIKTVRSVSPPVRAAPPAGNNDLVRVVTEQVLGNLLSRLEGVPRVVIGGNFATPWPALGVLDRALASYRLFALNAQPGFPDRDGVILESSFIGPGMRYSDRLRYLPCRLSLVPNLLATALQPDIVMFQASVPAGGTVSLGTEVNVLPAAIEVARARGGVVVAQLNRHMPYTFGDSVLAQDEIDLAMEADDPLASPSPRPAGAVYAEIGERVAALIPGGATLQLGIGAVPDAVLGALRSRAGLAVWSEMFSDGVVALDRAGALDPGRPITVPSPSAAAISTAGSTATRACGCCAPRRPTTLR